MYPFILRRHRFIGPWTRWNLILQALYWGCTLGCTGIGVRTLAQASARAGSLAVIQLVPLFFGGHLSIAADLIGMSLLTFRQIHSSMGIMTVVLSMFHVLVNILTGQRLNFQDDLQLYGFVVWSLRWRLTKHTYIFLGGGFPRTTYASDLSTHSKTVV